MNNEVRQIAINQIHILNPRHRDPKKFETIVNSIKNLGLKKPIHVSLREADEERAEEYDLVCGQGRIEAFMALGYKEIPAIVVKLTKQDRLLCSLVENMARRFPRTGELLTEIQRLLAKGYSQAEIAAKLDMERPTVTGLITLKRKGEERLLQATLDGKIPLSIAIQLAQTVSPEAQRELMKAYENKQLNHFSLRVVKRLMNDRDYFGKKRMPGENAQKQKRTTAEYLVNTYRRETQKQKVMIKKAHLCEGKLLFVISAFRKLIDDDNFTNLLRAEDMGTIPKGVAEKIAELKKGGA
jgi:ParB family chromosome partitioning protein